MSDIDRRSFLRGLTPALAAAIDLGPAPVQDDSQIGVPGPTYDQVPGQPPLPYDITPFPNTWRFLQAFVSLNVATLWNSGIEPIPLQNGTVLLGGEVRSFDVPE